MSLSFLRKQESMFARSPFSIPACAGMVEKGSFKELNSYIFFKIFGDEIPDVCNKT